MRATSLRNRLRDLLFMATAVAVLFIGSAALNERWRQSVTSASQDVHGVASNPTVVAIGNAASGVFVVIRDFSVDNTFLFSFLVVATILVVLMLRT